MSKPEVVAWYTPATRDTLPVVALNDRSQRGEPLIRLSDYERLQADHERLQAECEKIGKELAETELRALKFIHQCNAHVELYQELRCERDQLQTECDALRKDADATRKSVKLLNYLFARNIIAMQSAVIEWEKGKGAAAGMQWIWNTLFGPGQIPDEGETDAQAYFDREIEPLDAAMEPTK